MKRIIVLIAGIALTAIILVLTTYHANEEAEFPGYMEADLVLVGSEQGGRVLTLSVEEGDQVSQGDAVFTLESEEQEAAVSAASAGSTWASAARPCRYFSSRCMIASTSRRSTARLLAT